jgi:hypothetical protein
MASAIAIGNEARRGVRVGTAGRLARLVEILEALEESDDC